MLFHEEFLRCEECGNANFRKNTFVQLNKEAFQLKDETKKIQEDKKIIQYICQECGNLLYTHEESIS